MSIKHKILNFIFRNKVLISSFYFNLCFSWLPVKKNKIVFLNFAGGGYGCNPKYIAEEIIRQKLPVEMVWLVKPEFMRNDQFPSQIRLVDFQNLNKFLYELATAKIWINNTHILHYMKRGLRKKRNQFYINTWHGSLGIKRIALDVPSLRNSRTWATFALKDAEIIDLMPSNSDFETSVFKQGLNYEKNIVKIGHARNDIFFSNPAAIQTIKERAGIPNDVKIALYAPSFRDNLVTDCYNIDYQRLQECLEKKTGKKWLIVSRFHSKIWYKLKYLNNKSCYQHDMTLYPDIQELLWISDILISDYSSCMFDFMFTKRPCFIYATDIKRYNTERGLYYPLEATPFPIARNNDELTENIFHFNNETYVKKVEEFLKEKNVLEDGHASERMLEIIKNMLGYKIHERVEHEI